MKSGWTLFAVSIEFNRYAKSEYIFIFIFSILIAEFNRFRHVHMPRQIANRLCIFFITQVVCSPNLSPRSFSSSYYFVDVSFYKNNLFYTTFFLGISPHSLCRCSCRSLRNTQNIGIQVPSEHSNLPSGERGCSSNPPSQSFYRFPQTKTPRTHLLFTHLSYTGIEHFFTLDFFGTIVAVRKAIAMF